jgi:hypothetical protein
MAFDSESPEDLSRLRRAIRECRQHLQPYYDNRKVLIKALSDPCHRKEEVDSLDRKPDNPLDRMLRILTRGVVDQNPTLRIVRSRRPRAAGMLKSMLQAWGRRNGMAHRLQDVFQETILRWGIVVTGYETPSSGPGKEPYADVLDFDDYFIDGPGSDDRDIDFEGHCYRRRLDEIEAEPSYDRSAVAKLKDMSPSTRRDGHFRLYDWVDLKNVWMPQEGLELVIADYDGRFMETPPLRIRQYSGPPPGPYLRMDFGRLRGSRIPVSRASMLYDRHEFIIRARRQNYVQADRSLEYFGYTGESEKDAEKHRTAMDGEWIRFDSLQGTERFRKGGVDTGTMAAAIHADELFDRDAGNLNLAGGLGPSAPTARQEQGLGFGVQQMIDDMKLKTNDLAKRIYETAAWYMVRDPLRFEEAEFTTDSGNTYVSQWTPEIGLGFDPGDPEMEIVPGSMVSRSAEAQLKYLVESVRAIASMMVLPGEQPEVFRHGRFKELLAEYGNAPELDELFGEAPDRASVVPGVKEAGLFAKAGGRSAGGGGRSSPDKMAEKLIFSQARSQSGEGA